MKNLIIYLLFSIPFLGIAQSTRTQIQNTPTVFYGIDYSHAKFVGQEGFKEPSQLPRYFNTWNDFVYTEASKYDIKKAFGSSDIEIDLSFVRALNKDIDPYQQIEEDPHIIDLDGALEIAASYNFPLVEGIAIIIIAESYNKKTDKGSYWVVINNLDNEEIIFIEHFSTNTGGFGFRNYWARTYYNMLNQIPKRL